MEFTAKQIGQLVRDTRKRLGLTQRALSQTAGTGLRFIIELEQGKPTCQIGKALTALQALGIQPHFVSPIATSPAKTLRRPRKIQTNQPTPTTEPSPDISSPCDSLSTNLL